MKALLFVFVFFLLCQPAMASDEAFKEVACKWTKIAKKERRKVAWARECLGGRKPVEVPVYNGSYEELYLKCKKMVSYWRNVTMPGLTHRLNNPRGSHPRRWWPTARYVGWPSRLRSDLIKCITLESYGNPYDGPCYGIMQIHPVHAKTYLRVTGNSLYDRSDSISNLKFGLWLYKRSGWNPWVVM